MQVRDGNVIDALRDEWDDLADRVDAPPWLRPGWVSTWWHAFGRGSLHVLQARENGALAGVLPVYRHLGHLSATANSETPGFDVLSASAAATDELHDRLFRMPAHRVTLFPMSVEVLERDAWIQAARRAGYVTTQRGLRRSPYIDLRGRWDDYEAGLGRKLRAEVRRRTRRLEEEGKLAFDIDHGDDLESTLEDILRLEEKGWKGKRRTAIASRRDATIFYRRFTATERERGTLRVARLTLDSRTIAFDLSLEDGGRHFLLKTSFDNDLAAFAPGILLRYRILKHCFETGIDRYEFLGHAEPWKLRWTDTMHELALFRAYSPQLLGKAAWLAERRLHPLIKRARGRNGRRRS